MLDIAVTDDQLDPAKGTPDARILMQHDHVELWWCAGKPADCEMRDEGQSLPIVRQVAVGVAADGTGFARWLHPEGAKGALPIVTGTSTALRVTFDLAVLGAPAGAETWQIPFTVAYSDSDGPNVGQQTLVATSDLVWGVPVSFGRLVHPQFPPLGRQIDGWPALREALRP